MRKQNITFLAKKTLVLFLLSTIFTSSLFSREYMTQIKPYKSYEIKSQTSGLITYIKKNAASNFIEKEQILIKIDSEDEKIELIKQKESFLIQKEIVNIKKINYQTKNRIKQISKYDKNNEKLSYLEAKKALYLNDNDIKKLKREISKKTIKIKNKYIDEIFVKESEYINMGEKLFTMYDISKLKIVLYLSENEIKQLKDKNIFINKEKSDFTINKISKIKDHIKVSRYKVEFIKNNEMGEKYFFGKIIKVEIK